MPEPNIENATEMEDYLLARRIAKEEKVRSIVEQSATQFYLGDSVKSVVFRLVVIVLIFVGLLYSSDFDIKSVIVMLLIVAAVERSRVHGKLDALYKLFLIRESRHDKNLG